MPSTSICSPGLSEIERRSLPPLCRTMDWMSPVTHTSIEPLTAPFEPVMVAVPVASPAVKVCPSTVPRLFDTV